MRDLLVQAGRSDARVYSSSSISTTVTMILNGIGVGTIPIAAVARDLRERKVRLLNVADAALPPYDFVAAYARDSGTHVAAAVQAGVEALQQLGVELRGLEVPEGRQDVEPNQVLIALAGGVLQRGHIDLNGSGGR